jgi:UDP:flavonoid glycosyltransferase YjiC (YdhE family)
MVVNGGYSAVSEAIVLRKPVVVIPIENHAEQFINALTVESLGLGLMADQTTAQVAIARMFDEYGEFVRAHQTSLVPTDGAAVAADLIVRRISGEADEPEAGCPTTRAVL